jgi:hypothetical protein
LSSNICGHIPKAVPTSIAYLIILPKLFRTYLSKMAQPRTLTTEEGEPKMLRKSLPPCAVVLYNTPPLMRIATKLARCTITLPLSESKVSMLKSRATMLYIECKFLPQIKNNLKAPSRCSNPGALCSRFNGSWFHMTKKEW